ncbi:lectin-like domain-containing protein [Lactococcus taiwanensis]|uniref:lectin-like domain-containing protein n=1 Tax=Lactococcus taiwanensis TaxID=1151742 RepID=UPI0028A5CBC9|nr:MucBP domain-containing protein [Lactococcus taiwanensis]
MKFKTSILLATAVVTTLGGGALSSHNVVNVFGNSKVYAATSRDITITGETFPDYFQSNGAAAAHPYDEVNYIQTLTDDATYLAGNVTLTTKVDMSQSFSFKGEVNLGNKSKQDGGADGIGFLFHPGDTDVVGAIGGAAGIGGVQGAFGFKLDTYYNGTAESSFMADPDIYSASKSATKTDESFGAFVDGTDGVAKTIEKGSLTIPQPTDNQFLPFEIVYDGTTETMTVTYNGETWEKNVKEFMGDETAMSFSIAASTGGNKNLQQFKNVTFTYTIAQGTVVSHFVDEDGNPILDADGNPIFEEESGDLNTPWSLKPKEIPGYTFKEVKDNEPTEGTYTAND